MAPRPCGPRGSSASASAFAPLPPPGSPSDPHCRFRFPVASGAEMLLLAGCSLLLTCICAYAGSIGSDRCAAAAAAAVPRSAISALRPLCMRSVRIANANATRVKSCELERRVVHFGGHSPLLLFSSSCVMRVATRRSPRTCVPVYVSRTRTSTSTLLTCTSSWNAQIRLRDRFRRALPSALLCVASVVLLHSVRLISFSPTCRKRARNPNPNPNPDRRHALPIHVHLA